MRCFFTDGKAPTTTSGKYKTSYTLKLELWAEGIYKLDEKGEPIPLTDAKGTAKSKPTLVSVKVIIR